MRAVSLPYRRLALSNPHRNDAQVVDRRSTTRAEPAWPARRRAAKPFAARPRSFLCQTFWYKLHRQKVCIGPVGICLRPQRANRYAFARCGFGAAPSLPYRALPLSNPHPVNRCNGVIWTGGDLNPRPLHCKCSDLAELIYRPVVPVLPVCPLLPGLPSQTAMRWYILAMTVRLPLPGFAGIRLLINGPQLLEQAVIAAERLKGLLPQGGAVCG